jgi:hypothetical protein
LYLSILFFFFVLFQAQCVRVFVYVSQRVCFTTHTKMREFHKLEAADLNAGIGPSGKSTFDACVEELGRFPKWGSIKINIAPWCHLFLCCVASMSVWCHPFLCCVLQW